MKKNKFTAPMILAFEKIFSLCSEGDGHFRLLKMKKIVTLIINQDVESDFDFRFEFSRLKTTKILRVYSESHAFLRC